MTDTTKLPPLPIHPEPHTYCWTELELRAIEQYGAECRRMALEEAATAMERIKPGTALDIVLQAFAESIRALKDQP